MPPPPESRDGHVPVSPSRQSFAATFLFFPVATKCGNPFASKSASPAIRDSRPIRLHYQCRGRSANVLTRQHLALTFLESACLRADRETEPRRCARTIPMRSRAPGDHHEHEKLFRQPYLHSGVSAGASRCTHLPISPGCPPLESRTEPRYHHRCRDGRTLRPDSKHVRVIRPRRLHASRAYTTR